MAVTLSIDALDLNSGPYAVGHDTLLDLEAMAPHSPLLVDMQDRPPSYVTSTPTERQVNLTVYMTARSYVDRRSDYETLASYLETLTNLATLQWTGNSGVTKQLMVTPLSVSPDAWFYRATAVLVAPSAQALQVV